jgi:hypothetical protein
LPSFGRLRAARQIVVTSQSRCCCDRCCLQFAAQLLFLGIYVQLFLLNCFVVDKTGAVLRSDNFAEYKIVVLLASTVSLLRNYVTAISFA